jgi:hypothetical protein
MDLETNQGKRIRKKIENLKNNQVPSTKKTWKNMGYSTVTTSIAA